MMSPDWRDIAFARTQAYRRLANARTEQPEPRWQAVVAVLIMAALVAGMVML